MFGIYSHFGLSSNCLYNKNGTIPYFMILISNRVNSAVRCQSWELMINEFHWVKNAVSQKWKPGGNHKERDSNSFPVVSFSEKPLCDFHQVSTPGNSQPDDSLLWKLEGNLISGFHEFPHLETANPRIPPCFLTLGKFRGNPTGGFQEFPHK